MVGRAARAGLAPDGTCGLGLTGPPGGPEEEAARTRGAVSGLFSLWGRVFSEAAEEKSGLLRGLLGDLFSGVGGCGLAGILLSGLSGLEDCGKEQNLLWKLYQTITEYIKNKGGGV